MIDARVAAAALGQPLPVAALAVVADHGRDPALLRIQGKLGVPRPVLRLGVDGLVLEVALGRSGRLRIQREVCGRGWAVSVGVPTAPLLGADSDGAWLVSEWVTAAVPTGPAFLDRAVEVADRIAAAPPPSPGPPSNVWRAARRTAPARAVRAVAGGLPLPLWLMARRAAAALPSTAISHGDYNHRNVVRRTDTGELCVVDWEYLGRSPQDADLMRLWTELPDRVDRDALLDRVLSRAPAHRRREIATLGLYLALRLLAENVTGPLRYRNATDLAHARNIQREAADLARAHDVWPGWRN